MNQKNILSFNFEKSIVRTILINGEPFFSLKDICNILSINNRTDLTYRRLDPKGVVLTDTLTKGGEQKTTFINEKNLYICIFKSRKKEAERFRDWVFEDVLPTIRKTGSYNLNKSNYLIEQTNTKYQKQNSKDINAFNYEKGGVEKTIEYNRLNCILTTGKSPHEVIKEGKKLGLKSKQTTSAKEVLRNTQPEKACVMSFTDELTKKGLELSKAYEITKQALPIYSDLIKLGIDLPELNN